MADLMSALMFDVLNGTVTAGEAGAVISAGRQTLRLVEMSLRYDVNGQTDLMQIGSVGKLTAGEKALARTKK